MRIHTKLMGVLKDKTPASGQLDLPEQATIDDALTALDIPGESVQVFTVNGQLERDRHRTLADNDELAIIPPVSGG